MEYLISSTIGYLLGSFPSAYILLKKSRGKDITKEGSGNVGAMNSFEVTNSKLIGISVFLIDFLKGLASTLIPIFLFSGEFIYPALSLLFAVFSHCYNPWINFKGGRGLATAAGGAAFMFPYLLIIWALLWVIFMVMRKNILLANISSTVLSLFVVYGTSEVAVKYAFPQPVNLDVLLMISSAALIIIFIKHIEPLKELIAEQKNNWKLKK
ncbi:MAG: glycerol-3-phosphate acyltransferase [Ignavibacteriaceae bacterium]|jgi:glycerol-3-phosphate acyltransferase PlsY|nr:glycerol-3-phosphate acyltransferase [Ignavibacteriaceae bacterium]